jgi:uncharacterized membrane protein
VITALDTDQAKTLGIGVVVALVIIGVLINLIVAKIVTRVIVLVVAVALAAVVWTQREHIQSAAKNCDASFLGMHLTPSDPALKAHCEQVTNR